MGSSDGMEDGSDVGSLVGFALGSAVGAEEGTTDGSEVGTTVDSDDGSEVGSKVGLLVGAAEGKLSRVRYEYGISAGRVQLPVSTPRLTMELTWKSRLAVCMNALGAARTWIQVGSCWLQFSFA